MSLLCHVPYYTLYTPWCRFPAWRNGHWQLHKYPRLLLTKQPEVQRSALNIQILNPRPAGGMIENARKTVIPNAGQLSKPFLHAMCQVTFSPITSTSSVQSYRLIIEPRRSMPPFQRLHLGKHDFLFGCQRTACRGYAQRPIGKDAQLAKKLDMSNKCQIREGSYTDWVTVRARRGDRLVLELEDDRLEKVTTRKIRAWFRIAR